MIIKVDKVVEQNKFKEIFIVPNNVKLFYQYDRNPLYSVLEFVDGTTITVIQSLDTLKTQLEKAY